MLSGACVGTNNIKQAKEFYDVVLGTLDMVCSVNLDHELGYGLVDGAAVFWVVKPYNQEKAHFGNGTQIMFHTETRKIVQAFYDAAITMGGLNEGEPGPRDYTPGYYGAYVRDLDGNKLHVSIKL